MNRLELIISVDYGHGSFGPRDARERANGFESVAVEVWKGGCRLQVTPVLSSQPPVVPELHVW